MPAAAGGNCTMPDHQRDALSTADVSVSWETGRVIGDEAIRGMESAKQRKRGMHTFLISTRFARKNATLLQSLNAHEKVPVNKSLKLNCPGAKSDTNKSDHPAIRGDADCRSIADPRAGPLPTEMVLLRSEI